MRFVFVKQVKKKSSEKVNFEGFELLDAVSVRRVLSVSWRHVRVWRNLPFKRTKEREKLRRLLSKSDIRSSLNENCTRKD